MLDTVALTVPVDRITIKDHEAFSPSSRGLLYPPYYPVRGGGMRCVYNPTKKLKEHHGYLPRITLSKYTATAGFTLNLRIEFSAPKLLFGNNFDELTNQDFDAVISTLQQQLAIMGIGVGKAALSQANVSAIHYSKNLPLTDYTSASMVIRDIAKVSVTKQLDSNKTDYRNDGSSIKFHASSHEVIFYDKLKDLAAAKKSKKRSIEGDSAIQLELLSTLFQKPFEVLRIEARLGNRTKIKRLFERLHIPTEYTFDQLFDENISKTVLLDYWKLLAADMPVIAASAFAPEDLYDAIHHQQLNIKTAKVLQQVGALAVVNSVGMGGLRVLVEQHSDARTWQRLKRGLQNEPLVAAKMRYNPLQVAEQHLRAFVPLRLEDYLANGSSTE